MAVDSSYAKTGDIDLLNDAGATGVELSAIAPNNQWRFCETHRVKAEYRHPKTNATWSGCGGGNLAQTQTRRWRGHRRVLRARLRDLASRCETLHARSAGADNRRILKLVETSLVRLSCLVDAPVRRLSGPFQPVRTAGGGFDACQLLIVMPLFRAAKGPSIND